MIYSFLSNLKNSFEGKHYKFALNSAFIQIIPIASAPILSRLYAPSEFGLFALYAAFVAITASVTNLSIHNSILTEKEDTDAILGLVFSLLILAFFVVALTAVATLVSFFYPTAFASWPDYFVYYVLLGATVSSIYASLYNVQLRLTNYQLLGRNRLLVATTTSVIQITGGFFAPSFMILILANLVALVVAISFFLPSASNWYEPLFSQFNKRSLVSFAKKKTNLMIYTTSSTVTNTVTSYLPEIVLGAFFGTQFVGLYALANRVISTPLSFLSVSAQDIYRQMASKEFATHGKCNKTFSVFLKLLTVSVLLLVLPIVLVAPALFPLVFGEEWRPAGVIVQVMGPLLALRFISSPLSYVWIIRSKESLDFAWQVSLLLIALASMNIGYNTMQDSNYIGVLGVYSFSCAFWYGFCIFASRQFANEPPLD